MPAPQPDLRSHLQTLAWLSVTDPAEGEAARLAIAAAQCTAPAHRPVLTPLMPSDISNEVYSAVFDAALQEACEQEDSHGGTCAGAGGDEEGDTASTDTLRVAGLLGSAAGPDATRAQAGGGAGGSGGARGADRRALRRATSADSSSSTDPDGGGSAVQGRSRAGPQQAPWQRQPRLNNTIFADAIADVDRRVAPWHQAHPPAAAERGSNPPARPRTAGGATRRLSSPPRRADRATSPRGFALRQPGLSHAGSAARRAGLGAPAARQRPQRQAAPDAEQRTDQAARAQRGAAARLGSARARLGAEQARQAKSAGTDSGDAQASIGRRAMATLRRARRAFGSGAAPSSADEAGHTGAGVASRSLASGSQSGGAGAVLASAAFDGSSAARDRHAAATSGSTAALSADTAGAAGQHHPTPMEMVSSPTSSQYNTAASGSQASLGVGSLEAGQPLMAQAGTHPLQPAAAGTPQASAAQMGPFDVPFGSMFNHGVPALQLFNG